MRIGVLASHEGTTLQAILDACATGLLPCRIVVVISNNRDPGALGRGRAAGVPVCHLSSVTHPDPRDLDHAISAAPRHHGAELVVLAGYMKRLGDVLGRIADGRIRLGMA